MDFEKLNRLAFGGQPAPAHLMRSEHLAFVKLQALYVQYAHKAISREDGSRIKNKIYEDLLVDQTWESEYIKACTIMKLLRESDVPEVKRIVVQIDGEVI